MTPYLDLGRHSDLLELSKTIIRPHAVSDESLLSNPYLRTRENEGWRDRHKYSAS